jgi:NAD(P)-dependent dehydrogenase (short-subunit alcohol dehydrogenase family)
VALLARGGTGLAAAAADVECRGGHAVAIETDVADYEQLSSAAAEPASRPAPFRMVDPGCSGW